MTGLLRLWLAFVLASTVFAMAWVVAAREAALRTTADQCRAGRHDAAVCACAMAGVEHSTPWLDADPAFITGGLRPPAALMAGRLQWQLRACRANMTKGS